MIYGNKLKRIYLTDLLFGKRKKAKSKNNTSSVNKHLPFSKEEEVLIENTLKQIVKEYNTNDEIKEDINNTLKERGYDDLNFSEFICISFHNYYSKFGYENGWDNTNDYEGRLAFIVCDEDQDVREAACVVIDDMANELQRRLIRKGLKVKCDSGDGDEGCVYVFNQKKI